MVEQSERAPDAQTRWLTVAGVSASGASPPAGEPSLPRRLGRFCASSLWPVGGLTGLVSWVITTVSSGGLYVNDSRFEQFWNPAKLLARHWALWEPGMGTGYARGEWWPVPAAVAAATRALGASPALAERTWHVILLTTAGTGAAALLRKFRPRVDVAHLAVALLMVANPFVATFLLPSTLFLNYALAPWFAVVTIDALRDGRPRRGAALLALLVLVAGGQNVPGLVYSLLVVPVTVVYLARAERGVGWRQALAFLGRTGALVVAVSLPMLVRLASSSGYFAANIRSTERPSAVSLASSWAESLRGLGFWIPYLDGGAALAHRVLYGSWPIVLATFAVPIVALVGLGRVAWRGRLLFASLMAVGAVLMVGTHPPSSPSLFGRLLLAGYDHSVAGASFRNSYKAGAIFVMGAIVLAVVAAVALVRAIPTPRRRHLAAAAAAAIGVASAGPMAFGHAYGDTPRLASVPAYWHDAVQWLDATPGQGRVLIVPGTTNTRYRWGSVGDDIFDAMLTRPHIEKTAFSQSGGEAGDLATALDEAITNGGYRPGTLAPIARRLGIRFLVIRNDVDWSSMRVSRPASLQPVRDDPDLRQVASFGEAGENVAPDHVSTLADAVERDLPPVEVFEVSDVRAPVGASGAPPILVSGSGDAWPFLSTSGRLASGGPVRYTAGATAAQLTTDLEAGSEVVVTDTNQKRATSVDDVGAYRGPVLPAMDDGSELFPSTGAATYATYSDAARLDASGWGAVVGRPDLADQPAGAFDGDVATSWRAGAYGDPTGQWVGAHLLHATTVSRAVVVASPGPGDERHVTAATLELSNGGHIPLDLTKGTADVTFPAATISWFRVRIDRVGGTGAGAAGFAEVSLPGLDLAERLTLPSDLASRASASPRLAAALASSALSFAMQGDGQHWLRRAVLEPTNRTVTASALATFGPDTPDRVIDELTGGDVGAAGSSRVGSLGDARGGLAVDGDLSTGWYSFPSAGETLQLRMPPTPMSSVRIAAADDATTSQVRQVLVIAGHDVITVDLDRRFCGTTYSLARLEAAGHGLTCSDVVPLPREIATSLTVELSKVEKRAGGILGVEPASLLDVTVDGVAPAPPVTATSTSACTTGLISIDDLPVPMRVEGSWRDALDSVGPFGGKPLSLVSCDARALPAGRHTVDAPPAAHVMEIVLASPRTASSIDAPIAPALQHVHDGGGSALSLDVDAPTGGVVLSGRAPRPGWAARSGGRPLRSAGTLDTSSAWVLPRGRSHLTIGFGPERSYRLALLASMVAALACIGLAVWPERPRVVTGGRTRRAALRRPAGLLMAGVGALVAGVGGVVIGWAAFVAWRRRGPRAVADAGATAIGIAAIATVATVVRTGSVLPGVGAGSIASASGRAAGVLLLCWLIGAFWYGDRARWGPPRHRPSGGPVTTPPSWSLQRSRQIWRREALEPARSMVAAVRAGVTEHRHLVAGSASLVAVFAINGVSGAAYWLVAARFFGRDDIGLASALVTSVVFVVFLANLGLPIVLSRHLHDRPDAAGSLFSWSIVATTAVSVVATVGYLVVIRTPATRVVTEASPVRGGLLLAILAAGSAVAVLVDVRLMVGRRWWPILIRVGAAAAIRFPLLALVPRRHAVIGLLLSNAGPAAASGVVMLCALPRLLPGSIGVLGRISDSRPLVRYGAVNYLAVVIGGGAMYLLPVIVLANVTAAENATFYIAWSVVALTVLVPAAIGQVLLIEGSKGGAARQVRLAAAISVTLMVLVTVAAIVGRGVVVIAYGSRYAEAARILPFLVAGGIPSALATILLAEARLARDSVATFGVPAALTVGAVVPALVLVPHMGVNGAVLAWIIGNVASAAAGLALRARRTGAGAIP